MVAPATMPLVKTQVHALPSATRLRVLALLLACTTVVLVYGQIHALVVAAGEVPMARQHVGACVIVLVALGSCFKASCYQILFSKEATHPLSNLFSSSADGCSFHESVKGDLPSSS
ncbi:unnamed protein product [Prunus armeniaca]|uniref:Uncharacterized protein n=1 Tax=Prunus armeniaca TaxID=36596 RepID=A0A6J5UQ63_PRUAR|nr:unnamed protein product [Prunus armeniaca]